MTTFYTLHTIASTYGSSTYDTSNYNGTNATSTGGGVTGTGTTGTTASGGTLSNTGVLIGLIVGVAAFTLLMAMIVRIWRRPAVKPVTIEDDTDTTR